jgi:hypothetical protein
MKGTVAPAQLLPLLPLLLLLPPLPPHVGSDYAASRYNNGAKVTAAIGSTNS